MKHFLSAIIVLCFSGMLFSQQFYLKVQGGYGIGISPQDYKSHLYTGDIYTKNKSFSFGEGINIGASLGYFISSNAACEIEFQYSKSAKITFPDNNSSYDMLNNYSSSAFYFNPSFILMTNFNSITPYLKFGPAIAVPSIRWGYKSDVNVFSGQIRYDEEYYYYGGIAIGVNSAIGIKWEAGKNLNLSFEISSKNISYSPSKGKLEKSIINGESALSSYTIYQKEIEFVDKITRSNNDPNKPRQALESDYAFGSLAFSVGISIVL